MNVKIDPQAICEGALVLEWKVRRIDIRSVSLPDDWPVVRLELEHRDAGGVTGIGTAPGAFDATFIAASQILGISPRLIKFNVRSAPPAECEALAITVDVVIELDGHESSGTASGVDLVRCSIEAWLEAIAEFRE